MDSQSRSEEARSSGGISPTYRQSREREVRAVVAPERNKSHRAFDAPRAAFARHGEERFVRATLLLRTLDVGAADLARPALAGRARVQAPRFVVLERLFGEEKFENSK